MSKIEKIGNVKLDYKHYSGTDLYSDGDIENDILKMVMEHPPAAYPELIEKSNDWSFLYHLSYLRHNIVEWLPIEKTHKVLEIGAGCGAITGMLAEKAGEVVCVDLSEARSKINAFRHKEYNNIHIHLGNFADIEPDLPNDFDFILFIGVFEYCCLYIDADDALNPTAPYVEMLRIIKKHLNNDGHIAIAIENRFGLKYWAGCTEDHLGTYFSGLLDYPDGSHARTFTHKQFEKMLISAGINDFHFYYPYPDYKFMTTLFSDDRLPKPGELYDNTRNFDRHRMELFNEKKVFDSIIAENEFPLFSNSYFIYTGNDTDTAYLRYSNDRAAKYCIRTKITKDKIVLKTPLTKEAESHIKQMLESYQVLFDEFENTNLLINKCKPASDGKSIEFEYLEGKTLSELFDACIKHECLLSFNDLLEQFIVLLELQEKLHPSLYNHDLIFSNIIVDSKYHGKWTMIDYEWMLEREISKKENIYRALYCYLLEDDSRNIINLDSLFEKWDISLDDIEVYRINERKFQDIVAGERKSLAEIRLGFGMMAVDPKILIEPYIKRAPARHFQVFFDTGKGFSEAESLHLNDAYQNENDILIDITIPANTRHLRIDPADMSCVVLIHSFILNGEEIPLKKIKSNGKRLADGYYFFKTTDPNFYVPVNAIKEQSNLIAVNQLEMRNRLVLRLEVVMLPIESKQGVFEKLRNKMF